MKGPGVAEELAVFHPEDFGYKLLDKHFYTIPNSTQDRALIVLERME
jgi:16S rRNA (guanine527-N7)-methyltransferase